MTGTDYSDWVLGIHRKAQRFSIVFLQLGASNEPARRALINSRVSLLDVNDYLDGDDCPGNVGILLLDKVETLTTPNQSTNIGPLRERVFNTVEQGAKVVLLSRAPRATFPPVVGSSLFDDASFAHAPFIRDLSNNEWPTCVEDGQPAAQVLRQAVKELGTDICASLDRAIYENLLTGKDALDLLTARELEALDGSGLTAPHEGIRSWNFSKHLILLKTALDDVLADALDPPQQLSQVSSGLWKIERIIRREVRRRAIEAWPSDWRSQCLNGDLPSKVLDRATESAYLGARSVKQLRDPLEWLSLGELLQLKQRSQIGDLGLGPALWRQFTTQILPIRNRLAHMRHLAPEDAANVIKWKRVLEERLPP